jgi:hypothetical protein
VFAETDAAVVTRSAVLVLYTLKLSTGPAATDATMLLLLLDAAVPRSKTRYPVVVARSENHVQNVTPVVYWPKFSPVGSWSLGLLAAAVKAAAPARYPDPVPTMLTSVLSCDSCPVRWLPLPELSDRFPSNLYQASSPVSSDAAPGAAAVYLSGAESLVPAGGGLDE